MKARSLSLLMLAQLLCLAGLSAHATEEARFDVAVADAPARAFFDGLADGTPYNLVLEPGDTAPITLKLKNVTLIEVLDAVRDAYGYDYRRISSGFLVTPPSLQTRLYQLNYIDMERRGTSRMRVASGQVGQSSSTNQVAAGPQGVDTSQSGGLSEPPGSVFSDGTVNGHGSSQVREITGTSVSTRSSSDFWHDLELSLQGLVGNAPGRNVMINAQSGIVAVRAMPRELRDVTEFLHTLQSVSTRQVVLEAKILEVELSDAYQAGINWAAVGQNGNQTFSAFQTGPQNGFNSTNLLNQPSQPITLSPGNATTSAVTNSLGGAFVLAVDTANFASYIELLGTQGKTRVLSSPRVSTLNNQKAVIKSGSDQYFVIGVSTNTLVGTSSSTNLNVDLAPFFSGVALDVTPQISEDGEVILHIHPTVSQVTSNVQQLTVNGVADSLPLALSQVRESDSVVKARSGQLIVIGGLMQTTRTEQVYKLPGLGDIPVLGNLFRSTQRTEVHSELVILLRPIVLDDDEQWKKLIDEPLDRAHKLDHKALTDVR
jgi:MSHA biogenesis protein MshL